MFETVSKVLKFLGVKRIDISRGDGDELYLTRWALWGRSTAVQPTGFRIYLHCFHQSDLAELHCHPFNFISFILWGGYYEVTEKGRKWYQPGSLLRRRAEWRHQIQLKNNRKAWTLVITGPKIREWYFWCKQGKRHWKDSFQALKEKGNVCA